MCCVHVNKTGAKQGIATLTPVYETGLGACARQKLVGVVGIAPTSLGLEDRALAI